MSRRQLPGALILGLLASLLAHAVGFGGGHIEAGAYHALIQTLALAGAGLGLMGVVWAAFAGCGSCAQGSVLTARLVSWIPRSPAVAISGIMWFALIESVEPSHAGASIAVVLAMLVAAVVVRQLALAIARLCAHAVLLIAGALAAPRIVCAIRRYTAPPIVTPHHARVAVTRPPPAPVSF